MLFSYFYNKNLLEEVKISKDERGFTNFEIFSSDQGMSSFMLQKYHSALVEENIFLLKINFPSPLKFITLLLNHFGGANSHSNVKDPDTLWPVTPSFQSKARSHTD